MWEFSDFIKKCLASFSGSKIICKKGLGKEIIRREYKWLKIVRMEVRRGRD